MKKPIWAAIYLLLIASLLAACGGQQNSASTAEISVDMKEFTFEPANVTVPAGGQVTLNLSNSGALEHDWVIMVMGKQATTPFDDDDEPNVYWQHKLDPGTSETVTFTAPNEPGEYQLVCGTPAHLEAGMQGTLIVE
jgi:uncharacterized cupredoxin-like copper-binding protein